MLQHKWGETMSIRKFNKHALHLSSRTAADVVLVEVSMYS